MSQFFPRIRVQMDGDDDEETHARVTLCKNSLTCEKTFIQFYTWISPFFFTPSIEKVGKYTKLEKKRGLERMNIIATRRKTLFISFFSYFIFYFLSSLSSF